MALEVRSGTGLSDDDFAGVLNMALDYVYGLYTKIGVSVGSNFYPYVVLGYTNTRLEVSGAGMSASDSDSDSSYGVGAIIKVNDNVAVTLEYMNWYDDGDVELTGFNVGAGYKF